MTHALLVLEDGRSFRGRRFGAPCTATGEVVFNTSMMGYQEILTDPSYASQIVVMTYPMIGNYGIAPEDFEARRPFLSGLVVKEPSRIASNWRHEQNLDAFLTEHGIAGFCDLDTRAVVRHLREHGAMRGTIGDADEGIAALRKRALDSPIMAGQDLASLVSQTTSYKWERPSLEVAHPVAAAQRATRSLRVVAYDFGIKQNILRRLVDVGSRVTVVPANTSADDVLALKPDGVVFSNGPGDPQPLTYAIDSAKRLIGRVPILGICLGHQILALACGAKTFKMRFGHHGANHPVMDLRTRKVKITSHNHGFAVDPDSLADSRVEVTHVNLYDQTLEGLSLRDAPAFSVQYHPEAAPGPRDAGYLFVQFAELMREHRNGRGS
ncbi:MAG: carbamoyl phosphate synthase small subunit [Deltaproteobacteria bacterium RIFOXYA12_FULL_58_15]|nr:MAG: carbamoyl phosphate synthase small subunit [Deltaproteobacteria bacterium RIFOXYA12_FULL_58_15]OGR10145.1 MAG: carbamoyl phosphate synthase small subunit [Deltaproteobacteria bacterium RIFOXYB12_FULL_58_9]